MMHGVGFESFTCVCGEPFGYFAVARMERFADGSRVWVLSGRMLIDGCGRCLASPENPPCRVRPVESLQ